MNQEQQEFVKKLASFYRGCIIFGILIIALAIYIFLARILLIAIDSDYVILEKGGNSIYSLMIIVINVLCGISVIRESNYFKAYIKNMEIFIEILKSIKILT